MKTINDHLEKIQIDSLSLKEGVSVFIETRFNLKLWRNDKKGCATQTKEWLSQRLDLFETYCLPSVMAQTYKDFIWIVLFSDETDDDTIREIRKYQQRCPQLLPLFLTDEETVEHTKCVAQAINILCDKTSDSLIEIRLDNDDMIHKDFIKEIVANGQKKINHILSFRYGTQYFVKQNMVMGISYPHNHFLALSRINENHKESLIKIDHSKPSEYPYPICFIDSSSSKYMWCEVVHGHNVGNDLWLSLYQRVILKRNVLNDFGNDQILYPFNTIKQLLFFYIPALMIKMVNKFLKQFSR